MAYKLDIELSSELEKFRSQIETSIRPFVKILPKQVKELDFWQSKFGGLPYLPNGCEYPLDAEGKPLFLLAQINFEEVPELEGFPQTGILQIFVAETETYGANFENPIEQDGFRVIYFPNFSDLETDLVTDFSFLPKPKYLPLRTASALQFEKKWAPVSLNDFEFENFFGPNFFQQFGDKEDEIAEEYAERFSAMGHKMGGYAFFTQYDPREYVAGGKSYRLLLQMDTDDEVDMMWGDSGVANFFITEEDLEKLNFSRVFYNWDCY